jgi:ATP-binding cassette subfamily B protein
MAASFIGIAGCWVAWTRIAPLFRAAGRPEMLGEIATVEEDCPAEKLIEADRLSYRYRSEGNPVLQSCSLMIRRGERILLEGPSGGGKTTFASLLSGVRQPQSGLLLVNGLDRQTLGSERWRQRVAAAPQFHENHILTETLAFNLLMGRRWPPNASDMREAESVCRELGLGDLLDTMPSGLLQMVGEGGWQLSHGERSRVYIARALLQNADLVILDESFAALDPENLETALECTLRRAETAMVIAHP